MSHGKKKILFVHNIMAPYRLPIFSRLSKKYDLKLLFLRMTHNHRRWQVKQAGLEFNYIVSRGLDIFGARIPFDLLYELAGNKYDLIIVGEGRVETIPSCLISVFFKCLRRSKMILMTEYFERNSWLELDPPIKRLKRAMYRLYLRFLYAQCDAFVACSSKAAGHLKRMGVRNGKIMESLQAVFDAQPLPGREVKGKRDDGVITILTVAYLSDIKGIDLLISAFKLLNSLNTRLIIAGDGEIRPKLEAMAAGNDNIEFAGYVDGAEKRGLYEAADLFVLPSHLETWGLVVNEAMHYGLPVIITDAMGSTDLIDGNGIIVHAGDRNALLQALRELIVMREMRIRMGERSREIIRSVNLNAVTAPFVKAIGYVLGKEARW